MDAGSAGRAQGRAPLNQGFVWASSSPTPAEVLLLEERFPEVLQLSTDHLEAESAEWSKHAVLMRTFSRWVPAEAFLREFRRYGISGEITSISLAYRTHIFRFEDPSARDMILQRPWTINGQPVATDAWKPEFVPAAEEVTSALLWIRLPNLPIEFWTEELLREIVAPAGQFHCADAATLARNRGAYARVCARVDLRSALRPGVRLRGILGPFWQQFSFENMDGICHHCASIHLSGRCSVSAEVEAEGRSVAPLYGAWMAVLRQRKPVQGPQPASNGLRKSYPAPSSQTKVPSTPAPPSSSAATVGAWSVPAKPARRRNLRGKPAAPQVDSSIAGFTTQGEGGEIDSEKSLKAPVRAVLSEGGTVSFSVATESKQSDSQMTERAMLNPILTPNPFATLALDSGHVGPAANRHARPGPLKRARQAESTAPRTSSKKDPKKGKGKALPSKAQHLPQVVPQSQGVSEPAISSMVKEHMRSTDKSPDQYDQISTLEPTSSSMISGLPPQPIKESVPLISSSMSPEEDMQSGCQVDSYMHDDQEGPQHPSPEL